MMLARPAPRTAASNGKQLLVAHLARPQVRRRLVEPTLGQAVSDHVLAGGEHAVGERRGPGARGRTRSRARRRGTGPRRTSPRSDPSADRGSTSSTGASAWRAPVASIRRRSVAAIASTSSASHVAAAPIDCWNAWRVAGQQPVEGLLVEDRRDAQPRLLDEEPLDLVAGAATPRASRFVAAGEPGDLADARRRSSAASRSRSSVPSRTISNDHTDPSWATFSSMVIRASRSATRAVDRQRRVAVEAPASSPSALHRSAVRPPTSCRSATA